MQIAIFKSVENTFKKCVILFAAAIGSNLKTPILQREPHTNPF